MIRADTGVSLDSRIRGNERRSNNRDLTALGDLAGADHLGVDAAVGAAERPRYGYQSSMRPKALPRCVVPAGCGR